MIFGDKYAKKCYSTSKVAYKASKCDLNPKKKNSTQNQANIKSRFVNKTLKITRQGGRTMFASQRLVRLSVPRTREGGRERGVARAG